MSVSPWRRTDFRIAATIFVALIATQALNFMVFHFAPLPERPFLGARALAEALAAESAHAFAAGLGAVTPANPRTARLLTLRRPDTFDGGRTIDANAPFDLQILAAALRARMPEVLEIRTLDEGPGLVAHLAVLFMGPPFPPIVSPGPTQLRSEGRSPTVEPTGVNGDALTPALGAGVPDVAYFGPLRLALRGPADAWLLVDDAQVSRHSGRLALLPLTSLVVMFLAVIAVAQWLAARETRPLRALAKAAEQIGRDRGHVRAPHQGGSHEVAALGEALDRMQDRIQAFLDERRLMLGALSHDLRTPLTRMRLAVTTLDNTELQAEMIAEIEEMRMMVESALRFAHDDAADEPRRPVDLAVLAQSLCDDIGDRGGRADYSGPNHCVIEIQPLSVKRALANIIENADKFAGGAEVNLSDSGESVTVAVADHGPGIRPEQAEAAFAPFRRLEYAGEARPGAGLGLTIARDAILAQAGEIRLEPNEPQGLRVVIRLPRQETQ
jgi:signal transduction histidine kinase